MITHKTESFVRDIARFVQKNGHDVYLYGPMPSKKDLKPLLSSGVKLFPMNIKGILTSGEKIGDNFLSSPRKEMIRFVFASLKTLSRILLTYRVDVIHAHWVLPSGFIAGILSRIFRIPAIVTAHGRSIYLNPQVGFIVPQKRYARILLEMSFLNLKKIVAVSRDAIFHALQRGAKQDRCVVIYNGTDEQLFNPDVSGMNVKSKWGLKKDFALVAVRKFYKRKGLQYLIQALPGVIDEIPDVKLILLGDGPLKKTLERQVKELNISNHVIFTGMVPNRKVPEYLAAADACLVPSLEEGFGVAAVEAMAMKKPLISTQAGGLREVVDEKTTILVPPRDSQAIAQAIIRLWKNPEMRKKLGEAGRKKVLQKFNWNRAAREYIKLYNQILKHS
ncbi:MAG: glycosyltransferase family 4 protein [Candidatus Helarchaeota archaeon]